MRHVPAVSMSLPDFATCPLLDATKPDHEISFRISSGPIAWDGSLMSLGSTRIDLGNHQFEYQFIASIDLHAHHALPILRLLELIQAHSTIVGEPDDLPLVLNGRFKIGPEVEGPYEKFRPFIPKQIESVTIGHLKIPFADLRKREDEIIARLKMTTIAAVL